MTTPKWYAPKASWAMILLLALSTYALTPQALFAEDAGDPYTEEKIKSYIGELGNEDFAKRQNAERELTKAGLKAQKQLEAAKDSADAQVKATAQHLLAKLKFATMPPVDYLDLLPASSVVVLKANSFKELAEKAKNSAIGKLIESPALEPFKKKLKAEADKKPDAEKIVTDWTQRFSGQFAAAILEINPMQQDVKMAALGEITDPDPNKVFADLVAEVHLGENGRTGTYNDVDYIEGPNAEGAAALIGKHVILANKLPALKVVIDSFTTPGKFATSEAFAKIKPALGAKPDLLMTIDFEALLKTIAQIPFPLPIDDVLKSSGLKNMKFLGYSSGATGDSFEDRFVHIMAGPPTGMSAAYVPPAGVAPLNAAALAPANAVGIATLYLDGEKFHTGMLEYLASVKKVKESMQNMGMPAPDNQDPEAEMKKFEEATGLKIADLAASVKGEMAVWVSPSTGAVPGPPDIGGVITCESAEKANALSDAFVKLANLKKEKSVTDNPYKNRVIHQLDVAALDEKAKNSPYTPAWTVDANHLFIGSSAMVLQKQITSIDTKAPGLLTQADFVKALGNLSEDERKGSVLYVDAKSLLTMGAAAGLPLLQAQSQDEDLKKALAALPPPSELFKDIPPLLGANVVNGNESKTVLRAAVPPLPTLFAVLVGVTLFNNREALGFGGDEGK